MPNFKPRQLNCHKTDHLISMLVFLGGLLLWQLLSLNLKFRFSFGSPFSIANKIWENSLNGLLPYDFLVTSMETLVGFVIGILLGTLVGFLLWYSSRIARIFRPYIFIVGSVPVFAFAPLIIVWFGIGIAMKIALATLGTFLIALTQAYAGAKNVDPDEFKLFKLYGATRWQILQKVIFPSSVSWVLAALKLNVGFAILGAFMGEFISSDAGLGYFMVKSGSLYDIPGVFAGGFFLIILAVLFNIGVNYIEKHRFKIIDWLA